MSDHSNQSKQSKLGQIFQNAADNGFSGVALVRHRGEIVLHEAAGLANRETTTPNTIDTVYDVASITKQFTAALIMALSEAGKLSVEDRLADHFDDVPNDKADVTIHQLLTHTAGFGGVFGADDVAIDRDTFIKLAWATRLEFIPGTRYSYSNAGYSIAAAIAEIVSGDSYETALKTYILAPAQLDNTGYLLPDWSKQTLAVGYSGSRSLEQMSAWAMDGPYWNLRGNGGLLTTTTDLLNWHDVLSGESVLSVPSIEALQGSHVDMSLGWDDSGKSGLEFYGYGWSTKVEPPVGVIHSHTGSNGYFASFMGRAIDEDLVIIAFTNEINEAADQLVDNIAVAIIQDIE